MSLRSFIPLAAAVVWLASIVVAAQSAPTRSVLDGVYTEEQAARGAAIYREQCRACHGAALEGEESAPPLAGEGFNSNWTGTHLGELGERIRNSMPADKPGTLTRPQLADILAFMLRTDTFPAGTTPLDPSAVALAQIRFETVRK